ADRGHGQDEHVVQSANRDHIKAENTNPRVEAKRVERTVAREQRVAALKPGRRGKPLAEVKIGGQEGGEQQGAEKKLHPAGIQQTMHQPAPWIHPVERCEGPRTSTPAWSL